MAVDVEVVLKVPWCCLIGCDNGAKWLIVYGASPDSYTHSCDIHLSEMLDLDACNQVTVLEEWWANGDD